jgi:hypothetical protein
MHGSKHRLDEITVLSLAAYAGFRLPLRWVIAGSNIGSLN